VRARSLALKRVLVNLVTNAVNYGGSALVRLSAERDGLVIVEIEDDGPGIPPSELDRVFEPFHRGVVELFERQPLAFNQCEKAPWNFCAVFFRNPTIVCSLINPCCLVIKPRLIAAIIAITPNPEPPIVTVSPDVFLSLANPLTGCPKSQKYLNVCCSTRSSNTESLICANLSEESICVRKSRSALPDAFFPLTDLTAVLKPKTYSSR